MENFDIMNLYRVHKIILAEVRTIKDNTHVDIVPLDSVLLSLPDIYYINIYYLRYIAKPVAEFIYADKKIYNLNDSDEFNKIKLLRLGFNIAVSDIIINDDNQIKEIDKIALKEIKKCANKTYGIS